MRKRYVASKRHTIRSTSIPICASFGASESGRRSGCERGAAASAGGQGGVGLDLPARAPLGGIAMRPATGAVRVHGAAGRQRLKP